VSDIWEYEIVIWKNVKDKPQWGYR